MDWFLNSQSLLQAKKSFFLSYEIFSMGKVWVLCPSNGSWKTVNLQASFNANVLTISQKDQVDLIHEYNAYN